jgi:hypothetical protein
MPGFQSLGVEGSTILDAPPSAGCMSGGMPRSRVGDVSTLDTAVRLCATMDFGVLEYSGTSTLAVAPSAGARKHRILA